MTVIGNFLVSEILLKFKLLKYSFLHILELLYINLFVFYNFASLPLFEICWTYYAFIMISFLRFFVMKGLLLYLTFFRLQWQNVSIVNWNISRNSSNNKSCLVSLWNLVLKCFDVRVLIILFIATVENSFRFILTKVFLKLRKWFCDSPIYLFHTHPISYNFNQNS